MWLAGLRVWLDVGSLLPHPSHHQLSLLNLLHQSCSGFYRMAPRRALCPCASDTFLECIPAPTPRGFHKPRQDGPRSARSLNRSSPSPCRPTHRRSDRPALSGSTKPCHSSDARLSLQSPAFPSSEPRKPPFLIRSSAPHLSSQRPGRISSAMPGLAACQSLGHGTKRKPVA